MSDQYGLLVDYTMFTGTHSAEMACQQELDLPSDRYGIKEIQIGPLKTGDGFDGTNVDWFYLPFPTSIFSKHWGAGGDKAGQTPRACINDQSQALEYGKLEDLEKKMNDYDRPMVLFRL